MIVRKLLILFLVFIPSAWLKLQAQNGCSTLGQSPSTAFPVCGTATFKQDQVPSCDGRAIPVPGCGPGYVDVNPYYYKFTCFTGGTLGFSITPNTSTDDYDWQIFDVTNASPGDIYTNTSLFVSGNWSAVDNVTGTGSNNNGSANCAGYTFPNMNSMPTLIQGHNYLLMVSHFTSTNQSGYSLTFSGGTASITDTLTPAVKEVIPVCYGSRLQLVLNKKMKCSSLDGNGSGFTVTPLPPGVSVIGASANSCSSGFDVDTVTLALSGDLVVGNTYTVVAAEGSDGNSMLDVCGTEIPPGQSVSFTLGPPQPTPVDSIAPVTCAPDQLRLVFSKKRILCSSIAADGSDFTVTGTFPVSVIGATGNCDANGLTSDVLVHLSAPIYDSGNFVLTLKIGSDGNTIYDECGVQSLSSSVRFSTKDTVSAAALQDPVIYGCINDTIVYTYPTENGVRQWTWLFDNNDSSHLQNPGDRIYYASGTHTAKLIVSNGFCTDTTIATVVLDNAITSLFEMPSVLCPKDYAQFRDNSKGILNSWSWDFGDGTTSNQATPSDHLYPLTGIETNYSVRLIVGNARGCYDTSLQKIDVLRSCYIAVPTAFTPNGDGLNDYLYPLNAFKADDMTFQVYNRQGMMVFESHGYLEKWDGRVQGHESPTGVYAWFLQYTDHDSGKKFFQKGTSILIR